MNYREMQFKIESLSHISPASGALPQPCAATATVWTAQRDGTPIAAEALARRPLHSLPLARTPLPLGACWACASSLTCLPPCREAHTAPHSLPAGLPHSPLLSSLPGSTHGPVPGPHLGTWPLASVPSAWPAEKNRADVTADSDHSWHSSSGGLCERGGLWEVSRGKPGLGRAGEGGDTRRLSVAWRVRAEPEQRWRKSLPERERNKGLAAGSVVHLREFPSPFLAGVQVWIGEGTGRMDRWVAARKSLGCQAQDASGSPRGQVGVG